MRRCVLNKVMFAIAIALSVLLFAANIFYGSIEIPAANVWELLSGGDNRWSVIVMDIRLPQAVTALLAGAAISVAGLLLQTLFNNPLAGPEVLGINSGAGLGVAVVMLAAESAAVAASIGAGGYFAILAGAFIGALLVMAVILLLSSMLRSKLYLLVAGVAISYLVSSAISVLNYFATSEGVHSFVVWGMGSLGSVSMEYLPFFSFTIGTLLVLALMMMKPLNALLLGDAYATNLGVSVVRSRIILLCAAGLLTAVVTAFCGPVPFIGLAVPHIARLLLKSDNHRLLLPFSMLLGGIVLLLCNIICQLPGESGLMPLGAITPLIGAPVIIYVIIKDKSVR